MKELSVIINKTQPRRLVEADSFTVLPGDLYLSTSPTAAYGSFGIVTYVGKDGFSCLHNHLDQDTKQLRRFITDKKYQSRNSPDYFFNTEYGLFMRRQNDGHLELIAATDKFLRELEIVEEMYQDFSKKL